MTIPKQEGVSTKAANHLTGCLYFKYIRQEGQIKINTHMKKKEEELDYSGAIPFFRRVTGEGSVVCRYEKDYSGYKVLSILR